MLADRGLALPARRVRHGIHDRDVARQLAHELLAGRRRPTAVFASSDLQAMGVLLAARDLGLDVPGDLSVVGFDDIEVSAYVGLTTVRQPLFESGRQGAGLLLRLVKGDSSAPPEIVQLPTELVVRATSGPPRIVP